MQTPAQRCARLVDALEELRAQEEASLCARDFPSVATIQERIGVVIASLAEHAEALDAALRARIAAVQTRRAQTSEWLARELEAARSGVRETEGIQRQVARIAPVYGGTPAAGRGSSQLNAIG